MSINIRFPNITASTEREQIAQIKSYLHQLVEQLNYALPNIGTGGSSTQTTDAYELKSLIIQEVQEIETMFDQLSQRMVSGYVKASGWGADKLLVTDADGNVVARKLTISQDDDGNLYYELEE